LTNAANQTIYVKIKPSYIVDNVTYRYYQLLVKNSITGEILFSENTTISPGNPINSRLDVIGTSVDWYINGVNKFHLDNANPTLTKIGDFSSVSGTNYENKIDNAHYDATTNYVYNSSDVTLDKGLSQDPTFDLTSKFVTIPKDTNGNPVANVDGLVGVQPGQLIITDATYDEAKTKGEPVPGKHSTTTDRRLPGQGEALSSKDRIKDGKVVQRRYYGPDGKADQDIDYEDHRTPEVHSIPHKHVWDWVRPVPHSRPINKDDPYFDNPDQVRNLDDYWNKATNSSLSGIIGTGGSTTMDYSLDQLKTDLNLGHEVIFIYNGNEYTITFPPNKADGYLFAKAYDNNSWQIYATSDELIANATTVEGAKLKDIWNQVVVTDIF
jgi:hypothetical protein